MRLLLLCLFLASATGARAQAVEMPVLSDPELRIELFAAEPLIQQPIGLTFDYAGRLLVIESHTHFRPKDWKGPEHDQIVWLEDTDQDGKADKRSVWLAETDLTMDIAAHPDGSVYVATRNEVLRLRDDDDDGKPEKTDRKLVWMESEGSYPHNGLSGLAFDSRGNVLLGMGENLGAGYTLHGSDGSAITDQGEGGNIWKFSKHGGGLARFATGFWNAFGVCVDPWDHVFATDNDPDSSPPCRLLHVIQGGDYGYQFRYGRSGLHPFVSWNGQRTGTLPMLAGTGEAPCDVICYRPQPAAVFRGLGDPWHGMLLAASWVDHRIEAWRLIPKDGTFSAERKVLCQGGVDFRPVAFAVGKDGALYVSDWVKRSYELHGHGRVWKITAKNARELAQSPVSGYAQTPAHTLRERILHGEAPRPEEAAQWLALEDPFLFSAAIDRLSREPVLARGLAEQVLANPRQRAGILLAVQRGAAREGIRGERLTGYMLRMIERALLDTEPQVLLLGLHWISDDRLEKFRERLELLLAEPGITAANWYAALSALVRLDSEQAGEAELVERLKKELLAPGAPAARARLVLEILPDRDRHLNAAQMEPLIAAAPPQDRPWMTHYLGLLRDEGKQAVLRKLAFDEQQPSGVRAAAIAHLDAQPQDVDALARLAGVNAELQRACLQALQGRALSPAQAAGLRIIDQAELLALAARLVGKPFAGAGRPASFEDVKSWRGYLHALRSEPNIENGRRVFLSARLGGCAVCHRRDGLGSPAGPDLSHIAEQAEPGFVLESLLLPNRHVAPQWETYVITTTDGQARTGFLLAERGGSHTYADLTGRQFEIKIDDIVKRDRLPTSIMPEGIASKLTDEELRDLMAFLTHKRQP